MITTFASLAEAVRGQGRSLAAKLLAVAAVEAGRHLARDLGVLPGSRLCRLERLHLLDGEPLVLETSHLSLDRFPGLERVDFTARALYDVLQVAYGCVPSRQTETWEPVVMTPAESSVLDVPSHAAGLLVHRLTRDESGEPIESADALLRGDRCRRLLRWEHVWSGGPPA